MRDCIVHFFGGDEGSAAYSPTASTFTTLSSTQTTSQSPALTHSISKNEGKKYQGRATRPLQHRQRATLAQAGGRSEREGEPTKSTKTTSGTATHPNSNVNYNATTSTGISTSTSTSTSISTNPGTSAGSATNPRSSSGTSAGASPSPHVARPMFFHQLKTRDPSAFNSLLRIPVCCYHYHYHYHHHSQHTF